MFTSPSQQQQMLEEQQKLTKRKQITLVPLIKTICESIKTLADIFFDKRFPDHILQAALSFLRSFFHYLSIHDKVEEIKPYLDGCSCFVSLFEGLLDNPKDNESPSFLGLTRLRGIEALNELLHCNTDYFSDKMIFSVVNLFFNYPWNTFLHSVVTDIIMYSFESNTACLRIRDKLLFESGFIKKAIESEFEKKNSEVGFFGFFTLIFARIESVAETDEEFKEKIHNSIERYDDYINKIHKIKLTKERTVLGNRSLSCDEDQFSSYVQDFSYSTEKKQHV